MWHLNMCKRGSGEWETVGSFESVTAAARKIIELEGDPPNHGVFFQIYIETGPWATPKIEEKACGYLQYSGKTYEYAVRRVQH